MEDIEITKREIIFSIIIIAVMLIFGILISNKITDYNMDKNEKYNTAMKITKPDIFKYGMETNVGNAFVYGKLKAIDTVTYPALKGKQYLAVKREEERYTMHTRTVAEYHHSGKVTYTTTRVEYYWTWDYAGSEEKRAKQVTFCNANFNTNKFKISPNHYLKTTYPFFHIRYIYYGYPVKSKGTIFTYLSNSTIKGNNIHFYRNMSIRKTYKYLETDFATPIFWIFWILLTGGIVFGFYAIDNRWLEG